MRPGTDEVADSLGALWEHLGGALEAGWARREGGALVGVTGAPDPSLNGVWALRAHVEPAAIDVLLDEVAATGVPHCLQAREGARDALRAVAEARGLVPDEDIPLMCAAEPVRAPSPAGLAVRQLAPAEAPLHVAVAAAGFEAPPEVFVGVVTPEVLAVEGLRVYVGELDGREVATAAALTRGDAVGVFNVATLPDERRRGLGAALTARAVADGRRAGATYAWLQSSPAGLRLYERLGFATLERWACWVAP